MDKPKREHEKPKRHPPDKTSLPLMGFVILIGVWSLGVVLFILSPLLTSDCCLDEWTSTSVVATNQRVRELLTATRVSLEETATAMGLDVNQYLATQIIGNAAQTQAAAQEEFVVTALSNVPTTATAISDQQTLIAATQMALATLQARTILTLTAVATSLP
jgi:hypothetical protein